jgi:transposase-like protein
MSEARSRRTFTSEQKAEIVRRHLSGKEPVSKLAEELELQPGQVHQWVQLVLAQAEQAFDRAKRGPAPDKIAAQREQQREAKIAALEAKLVQKNEVIGELMQEHVQLKKELGER